MVALQVSHARQYGKSFVQDIVARWAASTDMRDLFHQKWGEIADYRMLRVVPAGGIAYGRGPGVGAIADLNDYKQAMAAKAAAAMMAPYSFDE